MLTAQRLMSLLISLSGLALVVANGSKPKVDIRFLSQPKEPIANVQDMGYIASLAMITTCTDTLEALC